METTGFRLVFLRELKQIFRDKPSLFITVIGPLLSLILVYAIFVQGVPRKLPIGVVDADKTSFSRTSCRMIEATPIAAVNRSYSSLVEAQNAFERGDINAIVYIPTGTEKNVVTGHQADIAIYLNNTYVLKSGLLNSALRKTLTTLSTGVKLKYHISKGKTYKQAYENSMPIALDTKILFNPFLNYSYYLLAAILPMLLMLFTLLSTGYGLGRELHKGSGRVFLRTAKNKFGVAIFAKILPYTISNFCMTMVMNMFLFDVVEMPMRGSFGMIVLSELFMIISYQCLILFLLVIFKNLRLVLSIGSAYSMMALTFSGLTFPMYAMPSGAQAFAQIFPFTYWLEIFIGQAMRGEPLYVSLQTLLWFLLFIVLGVLSLPRLQYILQKEKYWGRE